MIKVFMISESMTGGIRRHIMDYLDGADLNLFQIHIAYGKERADDVFKAQLLRYKEMGIKTYEITYLRRQIKIKSELLSYRAIKRLIKQIKPDIVHCHSSKAGGVGRMAAKRQGVPAIVYTPHAYIMLDPTLSALKKNIYTNVERFLANWFTDKTVHVSRGEFFFAIKKGIGKENTHTVIYNGINMKELNPIEGQLRSELGIPEDHLLIGAAMRLYKPKDPYTFYSIAKEILTRHKDSHIVLIGDSVQGYKEEIRAMIKKDQLQHRFHLKPFSDKAHYLIGDLDIYLFTSIYEGLPYSLLEAIKEGIPIVATDIPGHRDIVKDKLNGSLFEVGDVSQGVAKLEELIKDEKLIKKYKQNTLTRGREKFDVVNMIKSLEDMYKGEVGYESANSSK